MELNKFQKDFPILTKTIHGHRLAYLDNAATTQKPLCVIDAIQNYYKETNANIHRGVYQLSEQATNEFEHARHTVQRFLNAKESKECIFTKNTTEAVNLVAHSFGEYCVKAGDRILISTMEHHSNIVPWQMLCERKQAHLDVIPMNKKGELELDQLDQLLTSKTKLLAITHVSNALGTINPLKRIIDTAHQANIPVFVDGAQSAPHLKVDVQDLDCDFFTFSGHKIYGPTGIGVLYGKAHWLEKIPPYQGGGDMIAQVTFDKTSYNDIPFKFEAGTPPIAQAIGLGKALEYIESIGWPLLVQHEQELLQYATQQLTELPDINLIGTAQEKIGVISFTMNNIHPHDIGSIVDQSGVAIRTGHHCAMPIMDFFKVPATARASFGLYNTLEDIDQLITALRKVHTVFKR